VPLADGRGPEETWGYGALRVRAGPAQPRTAPARTTAGSRARLPAVAAAHPAGARELLTDNLASPTRPPIQAWRVATPRVQPVVLPTGRAGCT